ncbi:MAG: glutathione-disulfide reductase [Alphaproteobacteria bacterium]|nr:glutathione-disulfide reductase [Alphaproteobacteria bacterium]
MSEYEYDLFVIGAGSGGVRASRMSSSLGAKVAIAEDLHLGGTCVNVGCVPKKLMVYASHYHEDFDEAAGFGWTVGPRAHNWSKLIEAKNTEISRLNGIYGNLLKNAGVELFNGRATVTGPHEVEVDGRRITAERILVAVGGWPSVPDIPGKEHVITSNEFFYLDDLPKRVIVVGGGYIAVELAGIFNGLGASVTQLYRGPLFLRGFDEDIRHFTAGEVRKKGIDLQFKKNIASVEKKTDGALVATLEDGTEMEADTILYATGRTPKTKDLGLEAAGVEMTKSGAIVVNDDYQTTVPSIYALGDVIDRVALTPVAIGEGMVFAHNTYGKGGRKMSYRDIPTAVFSQPPIGTVGLTEEEARKEYGEIEIYRSEFRPMKHTLSGSDERSLMKLIVDKASDRVVGLHMVGPEAGEITQGFGVAMKAGATKADFDATVGIHPTSAEEFVTMREPARPTRAAAE